ncbi:MAG: RHS repeat-associated core domain-containing protein, partial [Acidobacteria bacterium]|nr:RHS repeat-associated core domain-containing protein [Acidobacteriota bacterium]
TYEFDSFGQLVSSTSTLKAEWPLFTYTAREADPETGQLFFRARFYDPHTGRFTAEDSVKQDNLYPYVDSNPTNWTDPQGTHKLWFIVSYWHTECVDHHRHQSGDESGTVISCRPPRPPCSKTLSDCMDECSDACFTFSQEVMIAVGTACCGAVGAAGDMGALYVLGGICHSLCEDDPCTFGP